MLNLHFSISITIYSIWILIIDTVDFLRNI
jgi:hypothetical protein